MKATLHQTWFEVGYSLLFPFLPPLYSQCRELLRREASRQPGRMHLLDVGGRKSHYTIGIPAVVTVSDVARESEVQKHLHLGITEEISSQIKRRRSNIDRVLYDDMTRSKFLDDSFDCVIAVEVLEHVAEDAEFVRNVHRILRPGGAFLMTTPNGDFLANHNPDHKRHYTREQLRALLGERFAEVDVRYAISSGRFRQWGLQSWSAVNPIQTAGSALGNLVNSWQSSAKDLRDQARETLHLIAVARK